MINKILKKLTLEETVEVFEVVELLSDSLTRTIMASLAVSDYPIYTDRIPTYLNEEHGVSIISRLVRLADVGLVISKKVPIDDGFCKKYTINRKGRLFVERYMKRESKIFVK